MGSADERELNLDPITDAPGAHPIGTGIGATSGGVAGAAIGAIGGPVGAAVGLVAGAVVGGLAGKSAAEGVNPTAEEAYWRDAYSNEPYYESGRTFDDYGPAYSYGWSAWGVYPGTFEQVESDLARDWADRKGVSPLSWDQARPATRAAWDRVDRTAGTSRTFDARDDLTSTQDDRDDVLEVLDDLLKTSRDGELGFKEAAQHTKTTSLGQVFAQHAQECANAAADLRTHIVRLGGKVNDGGSTSGALHRGWVSVRGSVGALSDLAMLEECERGEDVAVGQYRKALKQNLPADLRALVEKQMAGVQRNHDQIKQLRDAERAKS